MSDAARGRRRVVVMLTLAALVVGFAVYARGLAQCGDAPRALVVSLLARTSVPVCFAEREPGVVVEQRRIYLPPDANVFATAARLAHLARHLEDGSTSTPTRSETCARWLAGRDRREANARGIERDLNARFGVAPLPLPALPRECER